MRNLRLIPQYDTDNLTKNRPQLLNSLRSESGIEEELFDDFLDRVVNVESNKFAEATVVTDFREFMKIFKQKMYCEGLFVMKFRDTLIQKLGADVFVYILDGR
jgi:hypothetical protein